MMKTLFNRLITFVTLFSFLASPANALNFSFDYSDFGTSGNYKKSIVYTLLAALNPSNTAPLTALTGTTLTQVATSSVVVPAYLTTQAAGTTLVTIAAGEPAIPGAGYRDSAWYATDSEGTPLATPSVLASGLTRYDGSGLGVANEPAASNLLTYSNDLNASGWSTTASSAVTGEADPAGGTSTIAIKEDGTSNYHARYKTAAITKAASALVYTTSVFVKQKTGTRNVAVVSYGNGATSGVLVIINPSTGAVVSSPATFGAGWSAGTVRVVPHGTFYRIEHTFTSNTDTSIGVSAELCNGTTRSYLGDNTSAVAVGFIQLETGSVATTYIPTTTAAVTRAARYETLTGSELGTKITLDATPFGLGREQYLLGGTTGKIYQGSDNKIYATDGTTTLVSTSLMVANTTAIIGVDFAGGKLYFNGAQEDSDVALNPTWGATPQLGANGSGASVFNGTLSVLQSSSDAGFLFTSQIINLPNYEKIIYLADRKKKIKTLEEWREAA